MGYRLLLLAALTLSAKASAPPGAFVQPAPIPDIPRQPSPFLVTTETALTLDLYPISRLESNNGRYTDHVPSPRGAFYTALGHLGLKPSTAWGFYQRSQGLQMRYPGLDQAAFFERLQTDQGFYNEIASTGFLRMRNHFGLPRAVFAWRWGDGAAADATDAEIRADPYVRKYMSWRYPRGYRPLKGMSWPARGEELDEVASQ